MGQTNKPSKHDTRDAYLDAFRQAYPAIYKALVAFDPSQPVLCEGYSLRRGSDGWLAVARGFSFERGKAVVAFGAGVDLTTALRNLNSAITQGKWRLDAYASVNVPPKSP